MSLKWMYIVVVMVLFSYLRYVGYKRSARLEKKLDRLLEILSASLADESRPEPVRQDSTLTAAPPHSVKRAQKTDGGARVMDE